MKIFSVALFTLKEYRRSNWFFLELLAIFITLFLFKDSYWDLGKQDVYTILGLFTIIITPMTTLRILKMETNPRIYILLTKRLSRVEYLIGKALSVLIIDGVLLMALFVIYFKLTKLHMEFVWSEALVRMLPLYLILLMTLFLFLFLSPLILRGTYFLLGIAYLIPGVSQPEPVPPYLLLPVKQLITICYSNTGVIFTRDLLQGLIFTILFFALAVFSFNRREINYEPK